MPNWCEGKLKVRGNPENIVRWFTDCVTVYDRPYFDKNKFPNGDWVYNEIHTLSSGILGGWYKVTVPRN